MSSYSLALAHYRLLFPTLDSLGNSASIWRTEYDRVAGSALTQIALNNVAFEGGQASGFSNFNQATLLRALHARRAELDSTYVAMDKGRSLGPTILLGSTC